MLASLSGSPALAVSPRRSLPRSTSRDLKIVVEQHEIGREAGSDSARLLVEAEERGGRSTCHHGRSGKVGAEHSNGISYGLAMSRIGSCEPPLGIVAGAVAHADRLSLQHESRAIAADARHGVAYQHEPVLAVATKGETEDRRIDMSSVDDEAIRR